MNDEIRILVETLRRGQYENPAEKIGLLSAALREHKAEFSVLLSLLRAPQAPLRIAAIDACKERTEPELIVELVQSVDDDEARVRIKLAEVLGSITAPPVIEALQKLIQDADDDVRTAALKSAAGRAELLDAEQTSLAEDSDWEVRLAAASALGEQKDPKVIPALFRALANDDDIDVQRRCAEIIERRFESDASVIQQHLPSEIGLLSKAERNLKDLGGRRFPKLISWVREHTNVAIDPQALANFGSDLTALAEQGALPRAYHVADACATVLKLLLREPRRSIALLGAAGTGKSALVNELTYELARPENGGWRVLRISPTDFMAGTLYVGEWETKVRDLIAAVRKPRRVLIYVPNLCDLAAAGTWSRSDSSVATALAPYLEEGSILLLGESASEEFERGLGRIPSLQRLFDRVLVHEASMEDTRAILASIRDHARLVMDDDVLGQLLEVSQQFLGHVSRPGNAVVLLRAVQEATGQSRQITFRDVLNALSKSTGIPVDLLDDTVSLSQDALREFFQKRIIGQSEAVDAVVDLVTLIKAGLTDPNKPFGTFLFVGPTGVGKTELARMLAEFIFGDASRLKRFDMSEFASPESYARLIGEKNENGLLTDAVRQHPFSVVLLDEIEKSHTNVFDLCLQLFDAGRLTDGRGRMVDFRRTIIILTSNIGASAPAVPLGFANGGTPAVPDVDKERTFRELTRFFRPEFLNRLDRIVQFRPLSLEIAEQIARREIDLVLQRSGIRRRSLTVDIAPPVVSLVVREGYSPHFGARPLKRTVERLLLLPLARAISAGHVREAAILHLNELAGRVEFTVTQRSTVVSERPPVAEPVREPFAGAIDDLRERFHASEPRFQTLADRKSELLQKSRQPGFHQDAPARAAAFDEIHRLDQFLATWRGLGKAIDGLHARARQRPAARRDDAALRRKTEQLSVELDQLCFVAATRDVRDLGDAFVCLSLVDRTGASQRSVETLSAMYQGLARTRRMSVEVLGEYFEGNKDCAYLQVCGLGALLLLRPEAGLHYFDRKFKIKASRNGRELIREDREMIRVEVLPVSGEVDNRFRKMVRPTFTTLRPARERLLKSDVSISLFHEPTLRSLLLWTTGPRDRALERALLVFQAQIAVAETSQRHHAETAVRRYELGLSPRIKDARTGRATTNVDRVLKGHLEGLVG